MDQANPVQSQVESSSVSSTPIRRLRSKAVSQRQLSDWQRFFLDRLDYFLQGQRQEREITPEQKLLLSRAVYSTYIDCQTQGVGDEALRLVSAASAAKPSAN